MFLYMPTATRCNMHKDRRIPNYPLWRGMLGKMTKLAENGKVNLLDRGKNKKYAYL